MGEADWYRWTKRRWWRHGSVPCNPIRQPKRPQVVEKIWCWFQHRVQDRRQSENEADSVGSQARKHESIWIRALMQRGQRFEGTVYVPAIELLFAADPSSRIQWERWDLTDSTPARSPNIGQKPFWWYLDKYAAKLIQRRRISVVWDFLVMAPWMLGLQTKGRNRFRNRQISVDIAHKWIQSGKDLLWERVTRVKKI